MKSLYSPEGGMRGFSQILRRGLMPAFFFFATGLGAQTYNSGNPTAEEQLMLELINRARANPAAEAARFGMGLNDGIPAGTISTAAKPPLTFNPNLITAARGHTTWMISNNLFQHSGSGGSTAQQRMQAAGFPFSGTSSSAENIAWTSYSTTTGVARAHETLFRSVAGHRQNIMTTQCNEIGIGISQGSFQGYNPATVVTQNYAYGSTRPRPYILGVVIRDLNGNEFYDVGEAIANTVVSIQGITTTATTGTAGGYAIPVTAGRTYTVTFNVPGVGTTVRTVTVGSTNVKLDRIVVPVIPPTTRIIRLSGTLNFGTVPVGNSSSLSLRIHNDGNSALSVTGINYPARFSGTWTGTIPAGGSQLVNVTFAPSAAVNYTGTVTVNSNSTSGTSTIPVSGTGQAGGTGVLTLSRDQVMSPLQGSKDTQRHFRLGVPNWANYVIFKAYGGTGDADLYLRTGAVPTLNTYENRSATGTNSEALGVYLPSNTAYTYYAMLHGYQSYANLTFTGTYGFCQADAVVVARGVSAGRGVVNSNASGQAVQARVRRGRTQIFSVVVYNNGDRSDAFQLQGMGGSSKCRVLYLSLTEANGVVRGEIHDAMQAGTLRTNMLAPRSGVVVHFTMRPARKAKRGRVHTVTVKATSLLVPFVSDTVQGRTRVR